MKVSAGTGRDARRFVQSWVSLSWLVTGETVGGLRIYPQRNCLDRETALRMWTENVTWFSNEEGKKGRIEVGTVRRPGRSGPRFLLLCRRRRSSDTTSRSDGGRRHASSTAPGDFKSLDAPRPARHADWSPVRSFGGYAHLGRRGRPGCSCRDALHATAACAVAPAAAGSRPRSRPRLVGKLPISDLKASGARLVAPAGRCEMGHDADTPRWVCDDPGVALDSGPLRRLALVSAFLIGGSDEALRLQRGDR